MVGIGTAGPSPANVCLCIFQKSIWYFCLPAGLTKQMCFPYRRAIMRNTLEPDPYRYAAHGLRNNESLLFFFHLQGAIHRQGYAPVISLRQQWLPDTSAPCKRCAISRSPVDEAACMKCVDGPTRTCTNLICPVNQIPSFCFSDGRSRRASAAG